ncbi:MAG: ribose-5-phosphate isomerase RpiA [Candidatus Bipolaricaulota bacterium]|nr:MAG: ribose-5-phosphate isomerase RpiA [Candidatus Bipolaricaulota bacterium]
MEHDDLKRQAAWEAVAQLEPGMVIGLGHGSTAAHAVRRIGARFKSGRLPGIVAVPCSEDVRRAAEEIGIPLVPFAEIPEIDVTIDGADEVGPEMGIIKGGGGAMLREKMVAEASAREIIIVDDSKLSQQLGTLHPLPIEVVPFGWTSHLRFLEALGARTVTRREHDGGPVLTDQGNFLLDADFGPIHDPHVLAETLASHAGIVGPGLFLDLATDLIVASAQGVRHITMHRRRESRERAGRREGND